MALTSNGMEVTRCSIVDYNMNVIYDNLVRVTGDVKDYLTQYSGIDK